MVSILSVSGVESVDDMAVCYDDAACHAMYGKHPHKMYTIINFINLPNVVTNLAPILIK